MNDASAQSIRKSTLPPNYHAKRAVVVWLIILVALWPLVMVFFHQVMLAEYVYVYSMSLVVYLWCRLDAADVGRKIPWIISLAIICVVGVGFPLYLISVRRYPIGQAVSILFFCILLCVGIACASVFLLEFMLG